MSLNSFERSNDHISIDNYFSIKPISQTDFEQKSQGSGFSMELEPEKPLPTNLSNQEHEEYCRQLGLIEIPDFEVEPKDCSTFRNSPSKAAF